MKDSEKSEGTQNCITSLYKHVKEQSVFVNKMFHATQYVTNYVPIFLSNYKTTNLGHRAHKWRLPHDYLRQLGNECFTKYLVQDKPKQCNGKSKSMKSKNRGHRSQHLSLLGVSNMHRKTYRSQHLVTQNGNCERTRSHSSQTQTFKFIRVSLNPQGKNSGIHHK